MGQISFEGQVAIVTGAGGGLGRTYALELARRGAKVVVNDLGGPTRGGGGSPEMADSVVAEIKAAGGQAVASYDTVCTREGGEAIVRKAVDTWGRVDVFIGNAGNLRTAAIDEISDDDWESLHQTHLKGQFNVLRAAWPVMKKQGYGRILFVASAVGAFGNAYQVAYGAAKGGVIGMMHSVANEGREHGITANVLLPTAASRMGEEMDQRAMAQFAPVPMAYFGAAGDPEFNTPLVTYLVSKEHASTHGVYSSAGGRYARVFVAATDGWLGPRSKPVTVEDVAEHIGEIENRQNVTEFQSLTDEFVHIARRLGMTQG